MAKGMSMEEFREGLASEARIENEKLKEELDSLKKSTTEQISNLTDELDTYKEWCRVLSNRCMVQTSGLLCISCGISCCQYTLTSDDWDAITKFIRKNHLDKESSVDYVKITKFVQQMELKRLMTSREKEKK